MSTQPTINGTARMVEQPKRYGWSPQRGHYMVRTWKGKKSNAYGLCAELRSINVPYETAENGPNAIVTANWGTDPISGGAAEQPVSVWSRSVSRETKSIYEHRQMFLALGNALIEKLRNNVQNKSFVASDYGTTAAATEARIWFDLIMKGVESFTVEQPMLTWTRTVSRNFNISSIIAAAKANTGRILSVAQMIQNEGAPDYLVDDLSSDIPAFATWGYRKYSPPIDQLAEGKVQLINTYEGGGWPMDRSIYVAATF